jgi:hypothetical protein
MALGSLMKVLQYGGYGLEVVLLFALLRGGYARKMAGFVAFVGAMFAVDAVLRPVTLSYYGADSIQYFHIYWFTEVLLLLAAFLLICLFFRHAFRDRDRALWSFARPILLMILVMVLAISSLDFRHHYRQLFTTDYIWVFNENLTFICLLLNTVLYVLLTRLKGAGSQMQLLVCGLGIQFAGLTANSALVDMTSNSHAVVAFFTYFSPVCGLAMLSVWLYAVLHEGREAPGDLMRGGGSGLALPV